MEEFNVATFDEQQCSHSKCVRTYAYNLRFVDSIKETNQGFPEPFRVPVEIVQFSEVRKDNASLFENKSLPYNLQMLNSS